MIAITVPQSHPPPSSLGALFFRRYRSAKAKNSTRPAQPSPLGSELGVQTLACPKARSTNVHDDRKTVMGGRFRKRHLAHGSMRMAHKHKHSVCLVG
jgi:hypothetical protein